jgi:hypothetical protein
VSAELAGEIKAQDLEHLREKVLSANGFASLIEYCKNNL